MNEYIEKLLSFLSFISINDIKKYLEIDTTHTLDIFGNYNAFVSSLNNPQSDLYTYVWICENPQRGINYEAYKKLGISIYLVGKIGFIKYIKEYYDFIISFIYDRKDLNFFTRLYLSIIKAKQKIIRNKFQVEINKFCKSEVNSLDRIEQLFDKEKIYRLYLYIFEKEPQ